MRYLALACDYDGTLALNGRVNDRAIAALEKVRESGRRLLLVTGRELKDLFSVFPRIDLFERVVAENGALLYRPSVKEEQILGDKPPKEFIQQLQERGVGPISVGRNIVATWQPHETTVLEVIRDMGLELQVIFNKGAVMVLPAGINKGTGLAAALKELELSLHNVVGIGDAENDHAFLASCECAVAVANALPKVKERADYVTVGDHGDGAVELMERLLADDLSELEVSLKRHHILLGTKDNGDEFRVSPYGLNILIAGSSGSGKSTVAGGFLERLAERGYQFCIVDPEGDYQSFEGAIVLGDRKRVPGIEEILQLLAKPDGNAVVNLLGVPLKERPAFFGGLLPRLQELETRTGRPHWTLVDETHHLLPSTWDPASMILPKIQGMLFITVHPDQVSPAILAAVDMLIAVGESPQTTFAGFCKTLNQPMPSASWPDSLPTGEVLVWPRHGKTDPFRLRIAPRRSEHRRHRRKYAEGDLGPDRSFYFQGPDGKLNLRAQNLMTFVQLAEGVDDATWTHHLKRHDYSRWFRDAIKDSDLAEAAERIEQQADMPLAKSKALIKTLIDEYYTLPASATTPLQCSTTKKP